MKAINGMAGSLIFFFCWLLTAVVPDVVKEFFENTFVMKIKENLHPKNKFTRKVRN